MEAPHVTTTRDGDVLVATLNRPERLNALSVGMAEGLLAMVREAETGGARCLLVTGAGRGFCSGADLSARGETAGSTDAGAFLDSHVNPLMERLADLPIPFVVAINGPAAGAGAGIALAGDFVLMARSAYLLLAFVNIGLVPDAGATFALTRAVGKARATEAMMLGERIPADKAEAWGAIYRAVDDDALLGEAMALAKRLAAGPTRAHGLIRRNIRAALDGGFGDALRAEREAQREAGAGEDFREGVQAFLGKRPARFAGR